MTRDCAAESRNLLCSLIRSSLPCGQPVCAQVSHSHSFQVSIPTSVPWSHTCSFHIRRLEGTDRNSRSGTGFRMCSLWFLGSQSCLGILNFCVCPVQSSDPILTEGIQPVLPRKGAQALERAPQGGLGSPSPQVCKECLDVALRVGDKVGDDSVTGGSLEVFLQLQ